MSNFFNEINYSAANEDGASERKALQGQLENGHALCITGSGARTLELLISKPERLVSIDFNPTQTYLLELKLAAIKRMEYEEFIGFVGATDANNRDRQYNLIKQNMGREARAFFDKNHDKIKQGILYCGRWERYLKYMANLSRIMRGSLVNALMNATSISEQRNIWNNKWDKAPWGIFLSIIGFRPVWKYVLKEPGVELIPQELNIKKTIHERFDHSANTHFFRQCPYAWLLLNGKYCPEESLPCHLSKAHYPVIKDNIEIIEPITETLVNYLLKTSSKFNAYSVSDFGSYAPADIYHGIWNVIISSARNGAKVSEREFLVPRRPEKLVHQLQRDSKLEQQLAHDDLSFIYKFITGSIHH